MLDSLTLGQKVAKIFSLGHELPNRKGKVVGLEPSTLLKKQPTDKDGAGRQGRGDARGRNNSSGTAEESNDMVYTQSSQNGDGGKNVKKRLFAADGTIDVRGHPVPNLARKVAENVLMIESATTKTSEDGGSITPGKVLIVKRRKQGVNGEERVDDQLMLAASRVEDRPTQ
jgi:hypothetical protein